MVLSGEEDFERQRTLQSLPEKAPVWEGHGEGQCVWSKGNMQDIMELTRGGSRELVVRALSAAPGV